MVTESRSEEDWGVRRQREGEREEIWGGEGCIHYLDCGGSLTCVCMSKLIKLYSLNM